MSLITTSIARPVATTLLMLAVTLTGAIAFFLLPAAPVPEIDYPVISISASMPGASPQTMAASVATPLERHLGQIAGVTEMTSSSSFGATRISMQFATSKRKSRPRAPICRQSCGPTRPSRTQIQQTRRLSSSPYFQTG
jgi:multidrug efflux pump subunit AcrB